MADEEFPDNISVYGEEKRGLRRRSVLIIIFSLAIFIGAAILVAWLILRPKEPQVILQDVTLYSLNLTEPNFVTTSMQVTIFTKNRNSQLLGISYEKLDVFASYHNQRITLATLLPRSYQGSGKMAVWSPVLYGNAVPVSPYIASALSLELNAGLVLVNIKVHGTFKWKLGSLLTSKYHLRVNCPAYVTSGSLSRGINSESGMKYQFVQGCRSE